MIQTEIYYCAELAEVDVIVFGPQFIGRIEVNAREIIKGQTSYLCWR